MRIHILAAALLLLPFSGLQAQNLSWAIGLGSDYTASTPGDRGYNVKTDGAGNVYLAGSFSGRTDFDPGPGSFFLTARTSTDAFVEKLDANGNFLWAMQLDGDSASGGHAITIDPAGNLLLAGFFRGTTDFDPGAGAYFMTASLADIFVLKLDANGHFLWARKMSGPLLEGGFGIATDAAGAVYTVGHFEGTIDLDPGTATQNVTSAGGFDVFVSKLDASGNFVWGTQTGGTGNDFGYALVTDGTGQLYVTGSFTGTVDFDPGPSAFPMTTATSALYIWKLTASGNFSWARAIANAAGMGMAADGAGNLFYTGYFYGTIDADPGPGTLSMTATNNSTDILISKLDPAGNLVWAKNIGGSNQDHGNGLALDGRANVYTTGYFQDNVDFDPGAGTLFLSGQEEEIFLQKLDSSGNFIWAIKMGGPSMDLAEAVTVANDGNIYCTGSFRATADFNPGPGTYHLTAAGFEDLFLVKINTVVTGIPALPPSVLSARLLPGIASQTTTLEVNAETAMPLSWTLVDLHGKTIRSFSQNIRPGKNHHTLYLQALPAGHYWLRGLNNKGRQIILPFVKVN